MVTVAFASYSKLLLDYWYTCCSRQDFHLHNYPFCKWLQRRTNHFRKRNSRFQNWFPVTVWKNVRFPKYWAVSVILTFQDIIDVHVWSLDKLRNLSIIFYLSLFGLRKLNNASEMHLTQEAEHCLYTYIRTIIPWKRCKIYNLIIEWSVLKTRTQIDSWNEGMAFAIQYIVDTMSTYVQGPCTAGSSAGVILNIYKFTILWYVLMPSDLCCLRAEQWWGGRIY